MVRIHTREEGRIALPMKISGPAAKPKVQVDAKAMASRAGKVVKQQAAKEAEKLIDEHVSDEGKEVIKGLFGGRKKKKD